MQVQNWSSSESMPQTVPNMQTYSGWSSGDEIPHQIIESVRKSATRPDPIPKIFAKNRQPLPSQQMDPTNPTYGGKPMNRLTPKETIHGAQWYVEQGNTPPPKAIDRKPM